MSTYGPEITFDLPSGDDRVQALVDTVGLDYRESHHYRSGDQVPDEVEQALADAITDATKGHVQLDGFEVHSISHDTRVEITGSFELVDDLADDFESFAQEGRSA